jgi:antitoxin YefM
MSTVSITEAQVKLQDLINEVSYSHEPILISGTTSNAFLVSEEDWKGIQETIYLLSIPEVGASIVEGLATKRKPRALFVYKNERRDVSVLIKGVRYPFN